MQRLSAVAEVSPGNAPADPNEDHENMEEEVRRLSAKEENAAYDDITGMPLDRQKVQAARKEEIEYVHNKNVWTKIPRTEATKMGCKGIKR